MSYITDKFEAGEVKFQDGAAGWLFDSGEFRPLMDDAMKELHEGGYVDDACVLTTATARDVYVERSLKEYVQAQKNRTPEQIAEERFEARAAMGAGVEMVNIITGEKWTT
jgi:myo-inositol-1-phosphate synthase